MKLFGALIFLAVVGFIAYRKWPKITLGVFGAIGTGVAAFWDSLAPVLGLGG